MVFGLSSGKSADSSIDEITELKNSIKLVELDLEKRMILVENSINSMKKTIGSVEQFESSKDALIELQETKKNLREIEDISLISKLETIGNGDKIAELAENVGAIDEKIKLLSDAIDILSESRPKIDSSGAPGTKEIASVKSEIDSLKNALSKIASSAASPQKLSEIDGRISALETSEGKVNAELSKMYGLYREKISALERRISLAPANAGIPDGISADIAQIKKEIARMKAIIKDVVGLLQAIPKARGSPGAAIAQSREMADARAAMGCLSKKIAEIEKEISFERAAYPKDIMGLKKSIAEIKDAQKSFAETMELIAKMEKGHAGAPKHPENLKNIENLIDSISRKIADTQSLGSEVKAMKNEIASIKEIKNEAPSKLSETAMGLVDDVSSLKEEIKKLKDVNKKLVDVIETNIKDSGKLISGKNSGISLFEEKLNAFDNELASIKETLSQSAIMPASGSIVEPQAYFSDADSGKIEALEKTISEISERLSGLQNMDEKISTIENKMASQGHDFANIARNADSEEIADGKTASNMIKTLAEENKRLWQEIKQLKAVCSDIIKENREQPIIID